MKRDWWLYVAQNKQWVNVLIMHLYLGYPLDTFLFIKIKWIAATLTLISPSANLCPKNMIHAARPHSPAETAVHLSVGRL